MKKFYWVVLILCAQVSYAGIFEDEEARKKLNSIQDQLNNIQANIQSNVDAKVTQALKNRNVNRAAIQNQNTLQEIQDMLSKINGEVEVLQFQINNFQEREKVLYQEINDRITILENNLQSKDDIKLPSSNDPINQLIDNQLSETQENINQTAVLENNSVKDIQEDSLVEDFPPQEDSVSTLSLIHI